MTSDPEATQILELLGDNPNGRGKAALILAEYSDIGAADLLVRAAEQESHRFGQNAYFCIVAFLSIIGFVARGTEFLFKGWMPGGLAFLLSLMSVPLVLTVYSLLWSTPVLRKVRALIDDGRIRTVALELARYGDPRAVKYLLRVWSVYGKPTPDQLSVENELARLLPQSASAASIDGFLITNGEVVRGKVAAYLSPLGRLIGAVARRRDLPDSRADVLVELLRCLAASPNKADRALIERVAQSRAVTPNHLIVREAANLSLSDGRETPAPMPSAPGVTATPQAAAPPATLTVGRRQGE